MCHGGGKGEAGTVHGKQTFMTPIEETQLPRLILLLGLLAAQGNLGGHNPLSLGD